MTKNDYLKQLQKYLRKLPESDYQEAMDYFTEYFDEAGPDKESQVIQELGSPKEASREILSRLMDEKLVESDKKPKSYLTIVWISILSILAAPLAIPLLFVVLSIMLAAVILATVLLFTLLALGLTFLINGGYMIIDSFTYLSTSLSSMLLSFGIGLSMVGGSLLAIMLGIDTSLTIAKFGFSLITRLVKRGKSS